MYYVILASLDGVFVILCLLVYIWICCTSHSFTGTSSYGWQQWCIHVETITREFNTYTIVLLLFWNLSRTTRVSKYQKGKNQGLNSQTILGES